ncbi:MAG: recombination regulator RecX [Steroidobacteraceae bacterium]|nr:recombination regulator RecX [Steroidobacteraceae bacterium]MDW8259348.1 regulatory protein RecX [Gammaproteobacteria bacterium]
MRAALAALLARRDYSVAAARGQLIERGAPADLAAQVVAEFAAKRYLDDARYAGNLVAYYAVRGQGPLRVALELRRRGVAESLIERALGAEIDWVARCREVRRRKFGIALPQTLRDKGRQARFLQSRGFSSDHIRLALGSDPDE